MRGKRRGVEVGAEAQKQRTNIRFTGVPLSNRVALSCTLEKQDQEGYLKHTFPWLIASPFLFSFFFFFLLSDSEQLLTSNIQNTFSCLDKPVPWYPLAFSPDNKSTGYIFFFLFFSLSR